MKYKFSIPSKDRGARLLMALLLALSGACAPAGRETLL